ncbi:hypothetical protein [Carnobacterium maltaromaticum]|uniref:hypothetical protein n=1 Tax=Carnobacterium maltaromaticum TaxID=2751 RepID=UPI00191BBA20|nr:hypothetical protein [Carnobacterium maltaromaticum]CAD5903197.1 conserved hypothetical protein [Carnobacterium maltaromaticum]
MSYNKKEVQQFELLINEAKFITGNKQETSYSKGIPPELAGLLGSLGAGTVSVGAIFVYFTGMSGAQIMTALVAVGVGRAVGGIASLAAFAVVPAALVGGGLYYTANQHKLKNELKNLIRQSLKFEKLLKMDQRVIAIGLLKALEAYRQEIQSVHPKLK